MKTDVLLAFVFGVSFLLLSAIFAVVAFFLPKPENPEVVGNFLNVMQVILAISASGVAAVIPGFLSVSLQSKLGSTGTFGIRAGGAIAVFVIIYLVSPKSLALNQLNQRVGFNERLEKCRSFIPVASSPISGALQYCNEARDFDPSRWESYRQLARIHYWYEQYQEAIDNYKLAIAHLVGVNADDIRDSKHIPNDSRTEYSLMMYGIAMAYVGLANSGDPSTEIRTKRYQESLSAAQKSRWFVKGQPTVVDRLSADLLYLEALTHGYLWIASSAQDDFQAAVDKFQAYLRLPGIVPQWAEYHLACLYSKAAQASQKTADAHQSEARTHLLNALTSLRQRQDDKSTIQDKLMQCRLVRPEICQRPRGPEPMICQELTRIVDGDVELTNLVATL